MAIKRPLALLALPSTLRNTTCVQCRSLHKLNPPPLSIPKPTPFVPDVATFMTLIGRGMSAHTAKIPSWEALFTLSSEQLRESGLEPARARRYLLWWRDRFQKGIYGMGGDLKYVKDGKGALRIVEVKKPIKQGATSTSPATLTQDAGYKKVVTNTQSEIVAIDPQEKSRHSRIMSKLAPPPKVDQKEVVPVSGTKIVRANTIGGTGIEYVKGQQGMAVLKVKEGLWEQRRGHKVDGGERRKAEVRSKRAAAERKNAR
ncbi:hypothetical protein AC578_5509 [Pseudocercospora eumusae]|uniref:Small ribosomal subunit protein mS41 n=1 Tax=Pseudocercospora eumusae TaxID=321146 RepID=A0A139H853_9PEZI|nr:hypothetical protein AC578_5509 [Pseudocercospora eumusae]